MDILVLRTSRSLIMGLYYLVPETKGRTLEEIERSWRIIQTTETA